MVRRVWVPLLPTLPFDNVPDLFGQLVEIDLCLCQVVDVVLDVLLDLLIGLVVKDGLLHVFLSGDFLEIPAILKRDFGDYLFRYPLAPCFFTRLLRITLGTFAVGCVGVAGGDPGLECFQLGLVLGWGRSGVGVHALQDLQFEPILPTVGICFQFRTGENRLLGIPWLNSRVSANISIHRERDHDPLFGSVNITSSVDGDFCLRHPCEQEDRCYRCKYSFYHFVFSSFYGATWTAMADNATSDHVTDADVAQ